MKTMNANWKTFLLRALVLGAVIFVAVRTAVARDGVAGGAARSYITIAGTVSGAGVSPGMNSMVFSFRRRGSVTPCERTVMTDVAADGAFAVEIPTADMSSACPEELFDGSDVQIDVRVNGQTITLANPYVSSVPYAIHADTAAAATPDSGLDRRIIQASTIDPARVIVNSAVPQDGGFNVRGNATIGGEISGHGADLLAFAGACLATGRGGRFVVEGTVDTASLSCATVCASYSVGGCVSTCAVGWTIAPNGDHFGYDDRECTFTGPVLAGGHRVCCCSVGCFVPVTRH